MERFVTRHRDRIAGIVTGFDRMRFRGTLRGISHLKGLEIWLSTRHVLFKDFGTFAQQLSTQVTDHAKAMAEELGRPFEYLATWTISKEDRAREILHREGVREVPSVVFTSTFISMIGHVRSGHSAGRHREPRGDGYRDEVTA
jgi:hypothetical protein